MFNLEDTISINHNWGNGCNVDFFASYLKKELEAVERSIEDCKELSTEEEWRSQCQLLLKIQAGMDLEKFSNFLDFIATKRLSGLDDQSEEKALQAKFDLVKIRMALDILGNDLPLPSSLQKVLTMT